MGRLVDSQTPRPYAPLYFWHKWHDMCISKNDEHRTDERKRQRQAARREVQDSGESA